jgi:hypothetical protein
LTAVSLAACAPAPKTKTAASEAVTPAGEVEMKPVSSGYADETLPFGSARREFLRGSAHAHQLPIPRSPFSTPTPVYINCVLIAPAWRRRFDYIVHLHASEVSLTKVQR